MVEGHLILLEAAVRGVGIEVYPKHPKHPKLRVECRWAPCTGRLFCDSSIL